MLGFGGQECAQVPAPPKVRRAGLAMLPLLLHASAHSGTAAQSGIALHVEGKDIKENTFQLKKSGVEFSWELTSPADKLGEAQKRVLEFVEQHEGCTQTDIVSKLGKSKPQVSQIVRKLCNEGFLCREDGRLFINTPN